MASGNEKSLKPALLLILMFLAALVLDLSHPGVEQRAPAPIPQPKAEPEHALKRVLPAYQAPIALVTNKWIEATAAPTQPLQPGELHNEIEKLRWILSRGVRGEENELEIAERLKRLQRQRLDALIQQDAALSREGREAQLRQFLVDYALKTGDSPGSDLDNGVG